MKVTEDTAAARERLALKSAAAAAALMVCRGQPCEMPAELREIYSSSKTKEVRQMVPDDEHTLMKVPSREEADRLRQLAAQADEPGSKQ